MKKIIHNNRLIAMALFTVFTVATIPAAVAASDPRPIIPVELKFVGKVKNQSIFQLNFRGNKEDNEVTIIIRDEDGNSFYRENIKSENFTKKFLFNMDELGDDTLLFYVFGKNNKSVKYEINRKSHYVEEIVVNEVK